MERDSVRLLWKKFLLSPANSMRKRKLEELNLLDDFLFGSVVSYPGIGEQFARILLRIIFRREFGKLTVISQKNLQQLLLYFEDTKEANASNEDLKEIQSMVETVKRDKEMSIGYMKIFEKEALLLDQGREEGRAEGRREERVNTDRERRRAEAAEEELRFLREELKRLKSSERGKKDIFSKSQ